MVQRSLVVINFSAFDLQIQPFLDQHPVFYIFFTLTFITAEAILFFFLQLGCFGVDYTIIKLALISNSMQLLFALLCVSIYTQDSPGSQALSIVSYIGCAVSIVCLLVAVVAFIILR